ncbi:MAG: hypothetical protein NTV52_34800, partial [Acidobacteria bacterium]|nr:hypothetical protein [Acidobacteriota bacterium]
MLRLIKKHVSACAKSSEKDFRCKAKDGTAGKPQCPFYAIGQHPLNRTVRVKHHTGTSNEASAIAAMHEFERTLVEPDAPAGSALPPGKSILEALDDYIATKKHRSDDRRRKIRLLISRMAEFLSVEFSKTILGEVTKLELEKFTQTWDGAYLTLKRDREALKGFWKYCFDSEYTSRNVAVALPLIGDDRQLKERRVPTFTGEEIAAIFDAVERCEGIFGREGRNVAAQVKAFVYVQRYTGLAIGDVAKLRKDEIDGNTIQLNRKKTGEPVWTAVEPFVIRALGEAVPDSSEYFFWSGEGKLHTRTSKWGMRLQKLFAFAGVRVEEVEKVLRSGGVLTYFRQLNAVWRVKWRPSDGQYWGCRSPPPAAP